MEMSNAVFFVRDQIHERSTRLQIPEQVEEFLDDHEKLLDLLEESNTLCNVHNA